MYYRRSIYAIMIIEIPEKVSYIINHFKEAGYEAYAVGGCVRDAILGRVPEDWDITTSAKPEEIKKLFRRTIDTGIQHGTVTVLLDKEGFEVTTYRIDGEYEDSRHPKTVEFTSNLIEDLKRRDFTINAMAYSPYKGLVDAFDGKKDLESGVIKCVGNPIHRFEEDALRMLRAIRFSGQLGFMIEEQTRNAIIQKADTIKNISAERIRVEIDKLLMSQHPEYFLEVYKTGITKEVLPEFDIMMRTEQNNPHHSYNVGEHSIYSVQEINKICREKKIEKEKIHSILCWTMLLHDVGKPDKRVTDERGVDHFYAHAKKSVELARNILERLKFDNYTIDTACELIYWHDIEFGRTKASIRKSMNRIGEDLIEWLFEVQRADILAQSTYLREKKLEDIQKAQESVHKIKEEGDCITLKNLAVTGRDLIANGFQPGKSLGEVLQYLLEQVLEEASYNKKETLLQMADEWKQKQ